jgi:hypothetical protein
MRPTTPGELLKLVQEVSEHIREAPFDGVPEEELRAVIAVFLKSEPWVALALEGHPTAMAWARVALESVVSQLVDLRARCGTALRRTQWLEVTDDAAE